MVRLTTFARARVVKKPDTTHESGALTFDLDAETRRRAAPTLPMEEDVRRGRMLVGEVHDNYAAALGGAAGHAGLFGTAPAVGGFARVMLRAARGGEGLPAPFTPALVQRFITRSAVPGSSRALGWDTMLPSSSCGSRMSASAFGHVGFTGTSLWIDPGRDRYFVLLTNRACDGGTLDEMRAVRRAFHDALADV
jgi:CubicO group peptidase (beta-lactamase class C family)